MHKLSSGSFRKFVVVASSCTLAFVTFGVARLAGQLYVACRERFNTGRKEASLPFVLCYIIRNISGPIAGYLGNRFGLQLVTASGCLLAAISVGACFLVEDIVPFTILWGGCYGFSFGMGTILIVNILHLHFDESFNKVHGIFQAGGCMGSLVLPSICEFLLKNYGFSGTLLIISGIILNCLPAAMLLRNPQTIKAGTPKDLPSHKNEKGTIYYIKPLETLSLPTISDKIHNKVSDTTIALSSKVTLEKAIIAQSSDDDKPEIIRKNDEVKKAEKKLDANSNKCHCSPMTKLYSRFCSFSQNFNIFLDPTYILIVISVGISTVVATTLYTVIVDACRDKDIVEDVAVLMTFAVTDMFGRFILAYAADVGYVSRVNLYVLCCSGLGLLLIGLTWLKSFYVVLINITAFGILSGGVIVIPVGIIKDFIENDNINMAFASRNIFFAVLGFCQSTVIGYFRETLRSYDGLFYLMGSMCLLGAVIAALIPSAMKYRENRKRKNCLGKLKTAQFGTQ